MNIKSRVALICVAICISATSLADEIFNFQPGCIIAGPLNAGYWFLPIKMEYKSGRHAGKTTTLTYYVSCKKPSCEILQLPGPGGTLKVMSITDIPPANVRTVSYTENRIQLRWGLYNFELRKDGMTVTEDFGDHFGEGKATCIFSNPH